MRNFLLFCLAQRKCVPNYLPTYLPSKHDYDALTHTLSLSLTLVILPFVSLLTESQFSHLQTQSLSHSLTQSLSLSLSLSFVIYLSLTSIPVLP